MALPFRSALPSEAIATPTDKSVCYSGPASPGQTTNRRKAFDYARLQDLVLIDMTPAGNWLDWAKDLITSFKFSDDIPDAERLCIERLAKQKLSEDVELSGHDSDADFLNPLSSASEPPGVFQDLD